MSHFKNKLIKRMQKRLIPSCGWHKEFRINISIWATAHLPRSCPDTDIGQASKISTSHIVPEWLTELNFLANPSLPLTCTKRNKWRCLSLTGLNFPANPSLPFTCTKRNKWRYLSRHSILTRKFFQDFNHYSKYAHASVFSWTYSKHLHG